jgi:hypothetical protein
VHVERDYRREVRIEHRYLTGECRVAELGRSRVELDNRLLLPDGEVAVEGRGRAGWPGTRKAVNQGSSPGTSARRCCQRSPSVSASRPLVAATARRLGASTPVRSASSTTLSTIAASSSGLPASRS